ncbi:hypothetical protein FHG87_003297 [Trinorchestia longiramus]|nr:hypothetical protein FHG87_003297 [Trinorchestia longiramus]
MEEEERVIILLSSLPDRFSTLVTALEANEKIPSWEVVTERLLNEERRQRGGPGTSDSSEKLLNKKPIRCKWIFKKKTGPDESVLRTKLGLLLRGMLKSLGLIMMKLSSCSEVAVPSQPPYITRLQRSVSRTLYQALPKSTSPQELSSPEESTQQQQNKRRRNQPSCLQIEWAQTTHALTRNACAPTLHVPGSTSKIIFNVPASCLPSPKPAPRPAKVKDQQLRYFLQKDKITSFDAFKPERNLQKQYKNLIISRSKERLVFLLVDDVQIRTTVSFSGGLLSGTAENNRNCKATSILITR